MVLVDTSDWIRSLSNRAPFVAGMRRLLDLEVVAGHELIYGELLIGDRGGRKQFLEAYEHMLLAPTVPHREVVAFVRHRGLHGRGIGWIDVHLLASSVVSRFPLWTADPRLASLAHDLGLAYEL